MRPSPLAPLLLFVLALGADEAPKELTVTLEPGLPKEDQKLGYSSPRKIEIEKTPPRFLMEIPRFEDPQPLFFRLSLDETKDIPYYGAIDREKDAKAHNVLYL